MSTLAPLMNDTSLSSAVQGNTGLFAVYCALMFVLCLYWVLMSSRLSGLVLSALVNRFLLNEGETLKIGAVNFSFTQGRIALGSITYTTRNTSTSAVSGFITVRYWRRHVRKGLVNKDSLPARILVELSGVEVQIFNNSDKFRDMQKTKFDKFFCCLVFVMMFFFFFFFL
jgi:hypothetical protein